MGVYKSLVPNNFASGEQNMQSSLLAGIFVAVLGIQYAVVIANDRLERFKPNEAVCLDASKTLYTNVGTLVVGQDGKPIPCTPRSAQTPPQK